MPRYVEVDRKKLEDFLQTCGFQKRRQGSEMIYVRSNRFCDDVVTKVYTSFPYKDGTPARDRGQDAIRVTCAYESEIPFQGRDSFGIFKATKILRTGSEEAILDRLYHRMQEAYLAGNSWLRKHWTEIQADRKRADEAEKKHR